MINKSDEPCGGCSMRCAWIMFRQLQEYQTKKMKTCPCGYCIVMSMCKSKNTCILFQENFKYKVGDQVE